MQLDALAFGAHPDDVELTCAGTIIKLGAMGYKTGVIALTRAELGTRGSAEIREKEFEEAGKAMGLSVHKMLDLPDGDVAVNWQNKLKVIREIRTYKPKIVFAPYWIVRHPDHGHASHLVWEAAFFAGLKKIDTGQEAFRPNKVIYYACRYEFEPSFIVDVSEYHEQKLKAIQAYKSQFHNPEKDKYGEEETNISRPEFLESIITRAKQYGSYIGVEYGEPFLVREPMRLNDPVAFFGPEYLVGIQ
ncbi:bacillithiol biosynthesis deacetylase BshB1 [candidate division KSB1 bacterium]|nr:bacillithiol biosynthesis deacetylase BshB1 [candidate division KSB1 bacterium]NIR68837.1 bacillithiol biosynthesis deacetylase BshB1 [candidate division KSB1 bacterium]NIS27201.1 bacillithiol biosynthesis deacetylase BshB1 [candidate division KSB1 bacterium]NIT74086.1 bacillithiol biosynthesis deacetylase BshB1 [candidate division KSB1 bacterium]NIU27935.1 bacillithiol biosynthesis deacetylase BshB1 [candidate division KSB1 bacterium]